MLHDVQWVTVPTKSRRSGMVTQVPPPRAGTPQFDGQEIIGAADGRCVEGRIVGPGVGGAVGRCEGAGIGSSVGAMVGSDVGATVGGGVVGAVVGPGVRHCRPTIDCCGSVLTKPAGHVAWQFMLCK